VNTLPRSQILMKNGATPLTLRQLPNFSKLEATAIIINREVLADETPESSLKLTYPIIIGSSAVVATPNRPVSPDSSSYSSVRQVVEYQTCLTPVFRCPACSTSTPLHPALRISTHFPSSIAYLARFEYIAHRLSLVLEWGHRLQCLYL